MTLLIESHVILLDKEDFNLFSEGHIHVYKIGKHYRAKYKDKYMHRIIMKVNNSNVFVDHINGNSLDNRKINLRLCSKKENTRNNKGTKKNKFKGVYKDTRYNLTKPYYARITVNMRSIHLGNFETQEAAALAYNKAALKYFGEFAKINEVKS